MKRDDIDKAVRDIFSIVLQRKIDDREAVARSTEKTWDSLKHVELVFMVEDRFGIQFSEAQLTELDSLAGIVEILNKLS